MTYNPIKKFTVAPNFGKGHILHWEIDPTFEMPTPHSFEVEVSNDVAFSELTYSLDAGINLFIIDNTHTKQSWTNDNFYRLKLTTPTEQYYSRPIIFGGDANTRDRYLKAADIMRRELVRLNRFAGQEGWLLKRKVSGKPSAKYIDEISGVPLADTTVEFGVGLDNGYYPPIPMLYSIEDVSQTKKFGSEGFGVVEDSTYKFRTIGYPLIDVRDIMVDRDSNAYYNVTDSQMFLFPGTNIAVIQTITAKLIPNTDTVYSVQMPLTYEFGII